MKIKKISESVEQIVKDEGLFNKFLNIEELFNHRIPCEVLDVYVKTRSVTSLYTLCHDNMINWSIFIEFVDFDDLVDSLGILAIINRANDKLQISNKDFLIYCQFILNCLNHVSNIFNECKTNVTINYNIENIVAHSKELINIYLDELGYNSVSNEKEIFIISKEPNASAVAKIYPNIAEVVSEYRRVNLKGNLKRKRELLLGFANEFEPIRNKLENNDLSKKLSDDLGFLFNKCNIRHNNKDGNNKIEYIAKLENDKLESIYDKTYDYFLLAMLQLNYIDNSIFIDDLKTNVNGS